DFQMLVRNIIQAAYGIPGVFMYFIVIFAMRSQKRILSKSFISIFAITAIINTATWINSWLVIRLKTEAFMIPFYQLFEDQYFLGCLFIFLVQHFYYAQNVCVLLLALDRFAVIYAINRKTKFWSESYLLVSMLSHFLCLVLNVGTRLFVGILAFREGMTIEALVRKALFDPSYAQLAFGVVVFFICSVFNEISFFLISLCIFLAQILNLIVYGIITVDLALHDYTQNLPKYDFSGEVMLFSSDLFSIGPAFYTLLLPGPVRRLISHSIKTRLERYVERSQSSVVAIA
ncbi:srg-54, partial [Pristionchus pacificus]|uniref:Serpentine receptor class gamma n=1 Tax=Pristionchus pacificus TaxID=54126 RepID=A0A2A6C029_PRIPA